VSTFWGTDQEGGRRDGERAIQFRITTRSARAKSGVLLEMGSNFFKQTPQKSKST